MIDDTRVDEIIRRVKNIKILVPVFLVVAGLIWLGTVLDVYNKIGGIFPRPHNIDLKLVELSIDEEKCEYIRTEGDPHYRIFPGDPGFASFKDKEWFENPTPYTLFQHKNRYGEEGNGKSEPQEVNDYPVLDIKVRNDGTKVACLTKFEMEKIYFFPWAGGHMPPATTDPYEVQITEKNLIEKNIHLTVEADSVIRFQIRIVNRTKFTGLWTFQLRLKYDHSYLDLAKVIFDM